MVYFLPNGTMAPKTIKEKATEAIEKQHIGLNARVLICDQGSNNRTAVISLGVTEDRPYFL